MHAAVGSNTYAIYGSGVDKELTELVPGILNQLGPDAIASLRKIAETYQSQVGTAGGLGPGGVEKEADEEDDDDEPPALVDQAGNPAAVDSLEDVVSPPLVLLEMCEERRADSFALVELNADEGRLHLNPKDENHAP